MAGHSKWAQIKRQKEATDKKKGALFSKMAKAITIAARQGGGDPEKNISLRMLVEKAKAANMPKGNIERAIKRGTGELKEGEIIEEIIYEGYGPGGAAILIETATDNRNRTGSEVRRILEKHGGSLGTSGSVRWMFERKGTITVPASAVSDYENWALSLIDAGAEDIQKDEGYITVITSLEDLARIKEMIEEKSAPENVSVEYIPHNTVSVPTEHQEKFQSIIEALSEHDDVTNFYTNAV